MKDTNIINKLRGNDLYKANSHCLMGNRYRDMGPKGFAILSFLAYNSRHGKITTSTGIIMHALKLKTVMIQRLLSHLSSNCYIKLSDVPWQIRKNQFTSISMNSYKTKCVQGITSLIPYDRFQSITKLGYKHWSVYCYLFYKYYTQEKEYIPCANIEMQETLRINRHTIKEIVLELEVEGHIETICNSSSYHDDLGKFKPNRYKVLK